MDSRALSAAASLWLLLCQATPNSSDSLSAPVVHRPLRLPRETPEPAEHPPHGEGSGDLAMFTGASGGYFSNVSATVYTSPSWGPPAGGLPKLDPFFAKPIRVAVKVGKPASQRHRTLPPIRRSC